MRSAGASRSGAGCEGTRERPGHAGSFRRWGGMSRYIRRTQLLVGRALYALMFIITGSSIYEARGGQIEQAAHPTLGRTTVTPSFSTRGRLYM